MPEIMGMFAPSHRKKRGNRITCTALPTRVRGPLRPNNIDGSVPRSRRGSNKTVGIDGIVGREAGGGMAMWMRDN